MRRTANSPYQRLIDESLARLDRVIAEGSGELVFLAAPRRSGRTRALRDIGTAMLKARPRPLLLFAAVASGAFYVAAPEAERLPDALDLIGRCCPQPTSSPDRDLAFQ